jgi:hypothetical protein
VDYRTGIETVRPPAPLLACEPHGREADPADAAACSELAERFAPALAALAGAPKWTRCYLRKRLAVPSGWGRP